MITTKKLKREFLKLKGGLNVDQQDLIDELDPDMIICYICKEYIHINDALLIYVAPDKSKPTCINCHENWVNGLPNG